MLRIGQVARAAGLSPKTLRYYDEIGLLRPVARTGSGYRLYDAAAVEQLRFVRRAQALGLALRDIRQILQIRAEGQAPCEHIVALIGEQIDKVESQIARLVELRGELVSVLGRLQQGMSSLPTDGVVCPCLTDEASTPP